MMAVKQHWHSHTTYRRIALASAWSRRLRQIARALQKQERTLSCCPRVLFASRRRLQLLPGQSVSCLATILRSVQARARREDSRKQPYKTCKPENPFPEILSIGK